MKENGKMNIASAADADNRCEEHHVMHISL
jgi:hypothetical protein